MKPYTPIDCGFYSVLEEAAVLRKRGEIEYLDEGGTVRIIETLIIDFRVREKVEYAVLKNQDWVRLDSIIRFGDKEAPLIPGCNIK